MFIGILKDASGNLEIVILENEADLVLAKKDQEKNGGEYIKTIIYPPPKNTSENTSRVDLLVTIESLIGEFEGLFNLLVKEGVDLALEGKFTKT